MFQKLFTIVVFGMVGCSATETNTISLGSNCVKCDNVLSGDLTGERFICDDSDMKLNDLLNVACTENSQCIGRCENNLCNDYEIDTSCEVCVINNYPSQYYLCVNNKN